MSEYVAGALIIIAFLAGLLVGCYSTISAYEKSATGPQLIEVNK